MTCQSCGGVVGRDCFNPSECAQIGHAQELSRQQSEEYERHCLEARIVALEERLAKLEEFINEVAYKSNDHRNI